MGQNQITYCVSTPYGRVTVIGEHRYELALALADALGGSLVECEEKAA